MMTFLERVAAFADLVAEDDDPDAFVYSEVDLREDISSVLVREE